MSADQAENSLAIKWVETSSVTPYPRNAKQHPEEQIQQIIASMTEFGVCQPILVDSELVVIAGHGRLIAAGRLGLPKVPVVVADWLTSAQARAYRLADNKIAEGSKWLLPMVTLELQDIRATGLEIDFIGFDLSYPKEVLPPDEFREFDDDIETEYCCPRCNYKWSGGLSE